MTTQHFLQVLEENPGKALAFQYAEGRFVPESYHISEVKNVSSEAVDCAGFVHNEEYTIVQLWYNPADAEDHFLSTSKSWEIMQRVEARRPMRKDKKVFFEYGHEELPPANYIPYEVEVNDKHVLIRMDAPTVCCKPTEDAKILGTARCQSA